MDMIEIKKGGVYTVVSSSGDDKPMITEGEYVGYAILVLVLAFIILRYSLPIFQKIGKTGSIVISRIMGLLLTAIAIDLITTGIIHIFHV